MEMFLFRISTEKSDVWSNKTPKPVYYVARDINQVKKFA